MPLELGMFLGCKGYGGAAHATKVCLVLDVDQYRYQKFVSDIAGNDIRAHGGNFLGPIEPHRLLVKASPVSGHNGIGVARTGEHRVTSKKENCSFSNPVLKAREALVLPHPNRPDRKEPLAFGRNRAKLGHSIHSGQLVNF
jgi:hypothetical protein